MTGIVIPFRRPAADECSCKRCLAQAKRFPHDPPQLLLPLNWPVLPAAAEACA